MTVPHYQPLDYKLILKPQGAGYVIEEETLSRQRQPDQRQPFKHIDSRGPDIRYFEADTSKLMQPNWEHRPLETSLSQVPKIFRQPEDFRNRLASSTFYHVLNVDPRSPVRLPQPMRPATLPGKNGEELVTCLDYLRETERSRFEAVEDALRAAFPLLSGSIFRPLRLARSL